MQGHRDYAAEERQDRREKLYSNPASVRERTERSHVPAGPEVEAGRRHHEERTALGAKHVAAAAAMLRRHMQEALAAGAGRPVGQQNPQLEAKHKAEAAKAVRDAAAERKQQHERHQAERAQLRSERKP